MLIGDYSNQCRKLFGHCACDSCEVTHITRSTGKEWYRRFLETYAQELKAHPNRYREVLEDSEEFLRSLHERFGLGASSKEAA